jgi:hypothetical protein
VTGWLLRYDGWDPGAGREVLPAGTARTVAASVVAAGLFGWARREYGAVGVAVGPVAALW